MTVRRNDIAGILSGMDYMTDEILQNGVTQYIQTS